MKRRWMAMLMAAMLLAVTLAPVTGGYAEDQASRVATPSNTQESQKQTEDPTEAPSEAPSEAPTEAPTEAPVTEAPTEAPATDAPSEAPTEAPTEAPATDAPATQPPVADPLTVTASANTWSVFAGEGTVTVSGDLTGGTAPFVVTFRATVNGIDVYSESILMGAQGAYHFDYMPQEGGVHTFTVDASDKAGQTAQASVAVNIAQHIGDNSTQWEKTMAGVTLTGDWADDLVAIARTQLGYQESTQDFVFDESGKMHGYTRYGGWYGAPYAEWCGMFVSFCLRYAEIPASAFPREAGVSAWQRKLAGLDAYKDAGSYAPAKGDLVFFDWDGNGELDHVGIVSGVSGSSMNVIHGNAGSAVAESGYSLSDGTIKGYGSMAVLAARAGKTGGDATDTPAADASATDAPATDAPATDAPATDAPATDEPSSLRPLTGTALTNRANVNLRAAADKESALVETIAEDGVVVTLTGVMTVNGADWYAVKHGDYAGYIRADMLDVSENDEQVTQSPAQEAAATPAPGSTELPADEEIYLFSTPEPEDDTLIIEEIVEPSTDAWTYGDATSTLSFLVPSGASWQWQRRLDDGAWEDIAGAAQENLTLTTDMDALRYVYRCVAVDAEGEEQVSDEAAYVSADIRAWLNGGSVTEPMLRRALGARSLESLVLEGDELVYVRTGESVATYDAETGAVVDKVYGVTVAYMDAQTGAMVAVAQQ